MAPHHLKVPQKILRREKRREERRGGTAAHRGTKRTVVAHLNTNNKKDLKRTIEIFFSFRDDATILSILFRKNEEKHR